MNDAIKKLLADPEFLERAAAAYEEELAQRAQVKAAFLQSETFKKMVAALRDATVPLSVDSDSAAYFADRVKAEVGWDFATKEDIDLFFSVLSTQPDDAEVKEDEDCMFDNESFSNYGLQVFKMFGQGTFIRISNSVTLQD